MKTLTKLALLALTGVALNSSAQSFSAGSFHSLAVCNDGTVRAWGDNGNGQVGDGTTTSRNTPVQVLTGASGCASYLCNITTVSAGQLHSLALKSDGTVWAWGSNTNGQCGDGTTTTPRTTPVQVLGPGGVGFLTDIITIAASDYYHSLAIKNDGTVWAWGNNVNGQCGDGTTTTRTTPVQVLGPGGVGFLTGITAVKGSNHSLALKNDGTVWAWGYNLYGQVGNNTNTDIWTPVQVRTGASGCATYLCNITAIGVGMDHSLAVKSDGTAWAWGKGQWGRLGDGGTTDRWTPVQVSGLTGITVVEGGGYHSLAVKNDGTAWAWGNNGNNQLGDNTTTQRNTPVQVWTGASGCATYLCNISSIAAGDYHSFAVKSDGTAWTWGYNGQNSLGDGTTTQRATPVQPISLCSILFLPIELLSFDATPVKDSNNKYYVRCEWSTATEINNDYFTIERGTKGGGRGTGGIQFSQTGTVKGAGNSSTTLYYDFNDEFPEQGTSYYRLKQTDYDGKFSYSNIVPVFIGGIDLISISPNPVIDNFEYKIGSTETISVQVKVVNVLGQIVINKTENIEKGITSKRVDVSELSSGTYILQLITENKEVIGKQFQIK